MIVTELGWAGALGIATMAAAAPVSNRLSSRLSVGCHSFAATVTKEHSADTYVCVHAGLVKSKRQRDSRASGDDG